MVNNNGLLLLNNWTIFLRVWKDNFEVEFLHENANYIDYYYHLDFPKAPGANLAQGQIFLAKSKEKGWFVWFQYH